jgi:hypothetical protein
MKRFSSITLLLMMLMRNSASAFGHSGNFEFQSIPTIQQNTCSHYIATDGSDSNPGTSQALAWATFSHAFTQLTPGDTLCILDGTYYQSLDVTISGEPGNPITFQALNDGKVTIDGEYSKYTCRVRQSHAVILEGLICQRSSWGVVEISESQRIIIRRISAYDVKATDCNCHGITTNRSQDVLIEDVIVSGRARTALTIFNSQNITLRRVYARWMEEPTSNSMGVNNLMQVYGTSDSLIENNVGTIDGPTNNSVLGWGVWNHYYNTDPIASNNTFIGNIAFDLTHAGFFDSACKWLTKNNQFINNASINNRFGMWQRGDESQVLDHYTSVGGEMGYYSHETSPTGDCTSVEPLSLGSEITNSIFTGATNRAFIVHENDFPKNIQHDFNLFWDNTGLGTTLGTNETDDVDPQFNTAKWGYGAYLFPEPGSPREGTGLDGSDLGADVRFRSVDGTATDQPLWPWPMEERVCDELGVSVTWEKSDQISTKSGQRCSGGLWKTLDGVYGNPVPTFLDVPFDHWAHDTIEALYQAGYIAGCSSDPLKYCPDATMTRAESAVFVERSIHGVDHMPAQPTLQIFDDVPIWEWFAKWTDALWGDEYTAGCGTDPLIYCPLQGHTRAEGSVFFLRMLHGADYVPPDPNGIFSDVPIDMWYADWAEAAYNAGLIPACESEPELKFCPNGPLDRAMAAYMMVKAKGWNVP